MSRYRPIPAEIAQHVKIDETSETGLRWVDTSHCKNHVVKPGDVAGSWDDKTRPAYYKVTFKGKSYKAHRVIWFLHTNKDPGIHKVDHKDRNRRNNSVSNLRLLTPKHSSDNRGVWGAVQYKGVSWYTDASCFVAVFKENGVLENLGLYESAKDAALVWDRRVLQSGNKFKNLNFPEATNHDREQALLKRVRQRGTFLDGKRLRGVSFDKERNSFQAYVRVPANGGSNRMISLGRYSTARKAAEVRDSEVIRLGLKVKLNFPENMK